MLKKSSYSSWNKKEKLTGSVAEGGEKKKKRRRWRKRRCCDFIFLWQTQVWSSNWIKLQLKRFTPLSTLSTDGGYREFNARAHKHTHTHTHTHEDWWKWSCYNDIKNNFSIETFKQILQRSSSNNRKQETERKKPKNQIIAASVCRDGGAAAWDLN